MIISPRGYVSGRRRTAAYRGRKYARRGFSYIGRILARTGQRSAIRMLRPELKFNDQSNSTNGVNTSCLVFYADQALIWDGTNQYPNAILLNGVAEGDDAINRDGRVVIWKSLSANIRCIQANTLLNIAPASLDNGAAPYKTAKVRIMVILDKAPNGATLTLSNLLASGNNLSEMDHNNLDYRGRFRVLANKTVTLHNEYRGMADCKINLKFGKRGIKTTYIGTTGTIAAIATNALYILLLSDDSRSSAVVHINAGNALGYVSGCHYAYVNVRTRFWDP